MISDCNLICDLPITVALNKEKILVANKMRMQTLCEHGLGVKTIVKAYPEK